MSPAAAETVDVPRTLGHVAAALAYPGPSSAGRALEAAAEMDRVDPDMAAALGRLAGWLSQAPAGAAEERYSGLFDLSPVCTLHVGYHLFGEAYQRGALLAGLAAEMRKAGVPQEGDLPDCLPAVLRLLAALPPGEDRETLVDALLLPALTRMTDAVKDVDSPWADILRALPALLAPHGGGAALPPPERVTDVDLEADTHA
ncbi:MAG: hypothetical protein IPL89_14690 [Acidobacteria bacterium]|nr:hypothetical protein [Acidobacteriota bacterium]